MASAVDVRFVPFFPGTKHCKKPLGRGAGYQTDSKGQI